MKMAYGNKYSRRSTLRVKLYHKLREGKGTHISGPGKWRLKACVGEG
jgi:hypothetical protein